jgi:hypothetical protein
MFNSPASSRPAASIPKAPPQGSIPQPRPDGLPHETVPDWTNIGLFTAGIAVGAILGATVALLLAPASGDQTRHSITRRFRGEDDDIWDDLAEELELAAAEREEAETHSTES